MAIKLPQARYSAAPQSARQPIPVDQIVQIMGNNPVGQSLAGIGDNIGQALALAAQRRRQKEQLAALGKAVGADENTFSELDPTGASLIASSLLRQQQANKEKESEASQIALLESQGGFKPGELGSDLGTAKTIFTQRQTTGRTKMGTDLRERGLNQAEDDKFKTRLNNQKNRLVNDPRVKPLYAQDIGLKQIGEITPLVQGGNTVAAAALGSKMARGMGEVGVLTESDIARYVSSGRLDRKAADTLSQWVQGRPTQATIGEIQQISNVLSDSFSSKLQPVYNEYLESFGQVEGMTPDEVSKKMGIPYVPVAAPGTGTGKKATMRWNPATGKVEPI